MANKRKLIFLLLSIIIPFKLVTSSVFAATIFSDDFESGTSQWTPVTGTWNIQNIDGSNRYGTTISTPFTCCSESIAGDSNWTNYSFEVDLVGKQGEDKNLIFRYVNTQTKYGLHITNSKILLEKHTPSQDIDLSNAFGTFINNTIYHIKITAIGNNIKIYVDGILYIDYIDNSSPILNGKVGFRAGTGAAAPTEVWFDNVIVRDLPSPTPTPTPLPSLNVPDVKQYTEPWGNQIYDNATSWSSYPTIARWGCALTSANMVLQYHGFNINPGELNTWLLDQPDGYLRNGYLNWLSISRYSKLNKNANQPSLEFSRLPGTNDNLIKELKEGRPGIVEEIGHFVVVKSQTQSSFGINDPAYSDKLTLDSYGNNFKSIESYKPSSTDLSYIMLVLDPQFDLKVYKDDGSEVAGNTYIQEPIIDDINGDLNGSSLKIFMVAKPPHGTYNVEVNGKGAYILDSYLYDPEGKLVKTNLNGIVSDNNSDKYQIKIGQENSISSLLTLNSIMNDWNSLGFPNKNIITLLNNSVKLVAKGNVVAAKSNLGGAIEYLQENTPSLIDPLISQILQAEIGEYKNAI